MISDPLILSIALVFIMFVFLLSSIWIGVSLILTGILGMLIAENHLPPVLSIYDKIGDLLAASMYDSLNSWSLAALPIFILMGEILYKSSISTRLLNGLTPWLSFIPGKLLHINVAACSLFAAISGSSSATTATVGKITLDELKKRGYSKSLALGSLAGSGTLGFLIPPSLIMIIYGVLSNVSIGKLFMAGILPGFLLATLYSVYIMIASSVDKSVVPTNNDKYSLKDFTHSLKDLFPVLSLITVVLGSIYGGLATPTEAASLGVLGSVILAIYFKSLSFEVMRNALLNTIKTSVMISFIIVGAGFLSQVVGFLGIARAISEFIGSMGLSPFALILIIGIMYVFLGMILDGISIVVMTLPIVLPIIQLAGFDPLWFGIFLVFMVELSQITPPVGFSLFVIQSISGEKIEYILKATLPFFILMIVAVVLITVFPEIVEFVPRYMTAK
ncbi:TRAP dicarboxylate transporter, DctM subunit [Arcobacter nitrofigilis DSM 7299]|uniref:TRAP dicarboxylate transporter, DctM subunit n=1 Tax=Arcobacter nitrofigilis (strain ATCC 33309 / DSM 7299 / CCUG 15893 / LMG 7604 / NCTC 12251 / CI) TaxID=572480 RepID=D5V4N8_ARCNC|nr:TRAP transporter large permease subunit [Arcobacter nitrofigilis]ADG92943.1 TRAP dicarboxylate transporter, DctM subunit [Arcobacter nitrofigilis DSM 7299]